ncbi:MAG TPA: dihydroxyacetone kinase subunit DhaK [Nocardioidaceae bacterium]|nr:dihydroxyacetone kinase subunit DhaK [Nocardioidaceae bacterium]
MDLFNDQSSIVPDAITGYLRRDHGEDLAVLDGFPHIKVVVRGTPDDDRVAVVSGGGAGHEPAHVGYVAEGLLTAAVCGDVFASPSVDAVLAAILAVTGDAGCLLVVKNYTGDRLNFGLAAERAKTLGRKVEMVVVSDDIALPDADQPRGVAGTLFVHKVAGYHAARGDDLATVAARATEVAGAVRSIGLSLATCDLPGQPARSADASAELGLGIHGEPGVDKVTVDSAEHAVTMLVERLGDPDRVGDGAPLAVLLNNLGSVTPIEMDILTGALLASPLGERIRLLIGPAPAMTSLNMYGFSLSVLPLLAGVEEALTAPVSARAWPQVCVPQQPTVRPLSDEVTRWPFSASSDEATEALVRSVCTALLDSEEALNALDAKVGDGDTGTTFAGAARAVLDAADKPSLPMADPAQLCLALGRILASAMGGSSGVLMSILLTSAGTRMEDGASLPEALRSGADAVQEYGGAREGQRTLLDALLPGLTVLSSGGSAPDAARAAREGADGTQHVPRTAVGRSSYLSADSLTGVVDPGASALATVFEAAAEALG